MIWDEDDQQAMRRIFSQVWQDMRLTLPWPRHITSRWTTAPRGKSLPLPLPRSWLGVGGPTPLSPPHTPAHRRTHLMRFPQALALPLASVALAATAGFAVGTFAPTPGVGAPTPSTSVTDTTETIAWEIYENGGGSAKIRVDPTRPYRVDFMSATPEYPSWAGYEDAVVVGKDGRWYWYAVSYTD